MALSQVGSVLPGNAPLLPPGSWSIFQHTAPLTQGEASLTLGTCMLALTTLPCDCLPVLPAKGNSTCPTSPIHLVSQGQHFSKPPPVSLCRQFSSFSLNSYQWKDAHSKVVKAQPQGHIAKVQILALTLNCRVTLGELLNLSGLQFPHQ